MNITSTEIQPEIVTDDQRIKLNDIFKKLDTHELHYIYKILVENNVKHTKTSTSILFLDSDVPDSILVEIYEYANKRYSESLLYRQIT
jgi:hypothetical protein